MDHSDRLRKPSHIRVLKHVNRVIGLLQGLGETIALGAGENFITQGEVKSEAFVLEEGSLTVYSPSTYGDVTLARIEAPALIGEIAALAQISRTASVKAASTVRLRRIDGDALVAAGLQHPEILLQVIRQLGREIEIINTTISLYTKSLHALEQATFDPGTLAELTNPPPQLARFSDVFERFANEINNKKIQQEELASAALIQRSFLPPVSATQELPPEFDLAATMRPARAVGGDFYDFTMLDDHRMLLVIGDVCGKGMPASLFMAVVITTLRSTARQTADVQTIARLANELLCRNNPRSLFATAFIAIFDSWTGQLTYCNCGHCPALCVRADGTVENLATTGIPLGLFAHKVAGQHNAGLAAGDRLLLYSDGITEAANANLEEFGEARLLETVTSAKFASSALLVSELVRCTDEFAGSAEQTDDITCLALTVSDNWKSKA
jgi:phosphoserine phosphatase RsbU/P